MALAASFTWSREAGDTAWKQRFVAEQVAQCNPARRAMIDGVLSDVMPPLIDWPPCMLKLFCGTHVHHNQRCSLFFFLMANGMPPAVMFNWMIAQPGYLKHGQSAYHIYTLLRDYKTNAFAGKEAWNVDLLQWVPVEAPSFARDTTTMRIPRLNEDLEVVGVEYVPSGASYFIDAMNRFLKLSRELPKRPCAHWGY